MKLNKVVISLCVYAFVSTSHAGIITCGAGDRSASLDSATACVTGLGNPKLADINANFTSITGWFNEGELTTNAANKLLTAGLTSGTWGGSPIEGIWGIDASFWEKYDQAVISMHVGNGGGDPDYFSWLIDDQTTMGTWSYENSGKGGGLSNLKLWGADLASNTPKDDVPLSPSTVAEPAIAALFAFGIIGLGALRLSKRKVK